MAKNFAEIAFTEAVKKLQEKHGSRKSYERMEKFSVVDGLTNNEKSFIENRDSFYMASIGVKEFPYIQHRGGPKGFLKVLDSKQIGFVDFVGNKQYVSVGNIATNNNVSLIILDYPTRTRLKIFAKAKVVELKDNSELSGRVSSEGNSWSRISSFRDNLHFSSFNIDYLSFESTIRAGTKKKRSKRIIMLREFQV